MNDDIFYSMLNSLLDCEVYRGYIPESELLPAVSFVDIAHPFSRLLDGEKVSQFDTWRVTVLSTDSDQMKTIVNQLETLDNTSTDEFQRVFVIYGNSVEDSDGKQDYQRTTLDLRTYKG